MFFFPVKVLPPSPHRSWRQITRILVICLQLIICCITCGTWHEFWRHRILESASNGINVQLTLQLDEKMARIYGDHWPVWHCICFFRCDSYRIYRACLYGDIIDQCQIRCMLWGWSWRGLLAADVADPAREEPLGGEHDREGDPVWPRPPPVMSTPSTCLQHYSVFHDVQPALGLSKMTRVRM